MKKAQKAKLIQYGVRDLYASLVNEDMMSKEEVKEIKQTCNAGIKWLEKNGYETL